MKLMKNSVRRVLRGGSFTVYNVWCLRSAYRRRNLTGFRSRYTGFRFVVRRQE